MRMHVDESRRHAATCRIKDFLTGCSDKMWSDLRNRTGLETNVEQSVDVLQWIEQTAAADEQWR